MLAAMSAGVYDYLLKPLNTEELQKLAGSLRERLNADERTVLSRKCQNPEPSSPIGCSRAFLEVIKQAGRVAATDLPVLITGESGTGKEILASTLHQRSCRSEKPFVAVNCAAIPAELIESELFGHVKGSFTGADRDRPGLWEQAAGGTLFLDEITETSLAFQVKLLRTLQQGEIRRIGSNHTQVLDVRVIAASNRDVEQEVKAGRFRQDLFYRLNAVSLVLPPLRERTEDIPLLTQTFMQNVSPKSGVSLAKAALEVLCRYDWPGNVRELQNAIVSSVAICDGVIGVQHLPERIQHFARVADESNPGSVSNMAESQNEWPTLAVVEGDYVASVLRHTNGNKQAAARLLEIDRKTLDRMIKRHRIGSGNITNFPSRAA
jgi:DNA-binding NtrC family response regulator